MDDRVIDFNELKNRAKERDEDKLVDKLEDYMYSLYYEVAEGKITMADLTKKIHKYMEENNISQEKFLKMQMKIMERYGFDSSMIEEQLKSAGLNPQELERDYEEIRKNMSFQEKYRGKLVVGTVSKYRIDNDKNNVQIILEDKDVFIISNKKIDLEDLELSEFLCSYKKLKNNESLDINICENSNKYQY